MKLSRLIEAVADDRRTSDQWERVDPGTEIGGIHYRAQDVRPGGLFVAVAGLRADGHDYVALARANGAAAVVVQKPVAPGRNVITVTDSRRAMGNLSAAFHGHPAEALFMIGVTGTNGKTTTAYLLESILTAAGHPVGVIGTIGTRYGGRRFDNPVTTPESVDLQRTLADMRRRGVTHVVMEVSSHGIHQERIRGCRYDTAVFTNLSRDHLDFHGTMESYWACKKRLFSDFMRPGRGRAVVNADTPHGAELAGELGDAAVTVGRGPGCGVRPVDVRFAPTGTSATIVYAGGTLACRSPLVGRHNLENILCAAGAGIAMALPKTAIEAGIRNLAAVPGRLEAVANERERFVFVDYAHTPDALARAIAALRSVAHGRVICVFGCGGDRDTGKRSRMGEIAARASDLAVITSDNPRSEDPLAIIAQILEGAAAGGGRRYEPETLAGGFDRRGYAVEADRRRAIFLALAASRPGDTLLIAGKGHETYQIIGDRTLDFNDREVVEEALAT